MKALLLALVLSQDAGVDAPRRSLSVRHGLLELDDGRVVTVDGGIWFTEALARERVANEWRLAAENEKLKAEPPPIAPTPVGYVVAVVIGLGGGVVLGVLATREACKRFPSLCV